MRNKTSKRQHNAEKEWYENKPDIFYPYYYESFRDTSEQLATNIQVDFNILKETELKYENLDEIPTIRATGMPHEIGGTIVPAKPPHVVVQPFKAEVKVIVTDHHGGDKKTTSILFNSLARMQNAIRNVIPAKSKEVRVIETPPGNKLLEWSEVIFGPNAKDKVFESYVAEAREELYLVLSKRRKIAVLMAYFNFYLRFANTMLHYICNSSFSKLLRKLSK